MSRFVIEGSTVIDGSGAPGRVADVLVVDDRIAQVGRVDTAGCERIDGSNRVLSPGFIDTHSHDDYAVVLHPDMAFKVRGGVTTVIVGNCGMGAAPHDSGDGFLELIHGDTAVPSWGSYFEYFEYLRGNPPTVNVAALIGHGTIRAATMGLQDRKPTASEFETMRLLIAEGMEAGCLGMSSGLVYPPSLYADVDELSTLAESISSRLGVYASHIRNENDRLLDSIGEAIEVGRRAEVTVVVSHLKAAGKENFGKMPQALDLIDNAGPSVAADQYPYTAGSTGLAAVVSGTLGAIGTSDIVIASTARHPEWHGRALSELVEEVGAPDSEIAERVLALEPQATVVIHVMDEEDVQTALRHPEVMVGSDGVPTLAGHPHPRLYGSFARVLGRYSRDLGLLTLETAIYKMTGRPASVFGIKDRGEIRPGAFADLVLFDPDRVADTGTFRDPHRYPIGIEHVWINGQSAVAKSALTGIRSGRPLVRS